MIEVHFGDNLDVITEFPSDTRFDSYYRWYTRFLAETRPSVPGRDRIPFGLTHDVIRIASDNTSQTRYRDL